ncbi:MAG: hypothetical protein P9M14_03755 [Candidatus Alcyoniella australis]|nr:hypothetical protein [Candidatus Alcyoniella australis]
MRSYSLTIALSVLMVLALALGATAQNQVPPSKGFWGIQEGKLIQLLRPDVEVKDYEGKSVKGFPKNTQFKVFDSKPRFVMWDDFVDPGNGTAVMLVYEGKKLVDGQVMQTDRWQLDMYVRQGDGISVQTAAVPDQQNMQQVYFASPLKPGYYVLYFGDSMSKVIQDKYKNNLFVFEVK